MRHLRGATRLATFAAAAAIGAASLSGAVVSAQESGQVEIFSYWTAGGEAEGLAALEDIFTRDHPNIEIVNAVIAGGAGVNANAVLATRMQGGNPPDTFQIHGGAELIDTWVKTGFMEPLTGLYDELGLADKFPAGIIDLVSYEGEPYSVPVNVHRNGVLWFNKAIMDANGLTAPTTWDEFFAAADTLQAAGITPVALGDKNAWPALNLFEQILLSQLGPDDYRAIWTGGVPWTDSRVTDALNIMSRVLDYVNDDHATLTWDQASGLLVSGDAAMNVMGDWAKGYFTSNGWVTGEDFGWAPVPGTDGSFTVVTDTFALPLGAKDHDNALLWLKTLASVEGQDAFNPLKGSIPARIDADRSLYDAYSTGAMDAFASDQLVPSEANGPATIPALLQPITDAISVFVSNRDVAAAQAAINDACVSTGVCSS